MRNSIESLDIDILRAEHDIVARDLRAAKRLEVLRQAWHRQSKPLAVAAVGVVAVAWWWRRRQARVAGPGQAATRRRSSIPGAGQLMALAMPLILHQLLPRILPDRWRPWLSNPMVGSLWRVAGLGKMP